MQGAGGLGHIGIQASRRSPATRIIVVDRNPDALALAKQIGADETVLADGNHVDAVKDLPTATAATSCSTSSPSRARRWTPGR